MQTNYSTLLIPESEKNIDIYICKSVIKKNMYKKIIIYTDLLNNPIKRIQSVLASKKYEVLILDRLNTNMLSENNNSLIFVDCRQSFFIIDEIRNNHKVTVPIMAIVNDDFNEKNKLLERKIYDYLTTSFSDTELITKTNIYMLYLAAWKIDVFVDSDKDPLTKGHDKEYFLVKNACNYLLDNISEFISIETLCRTIGTNRNSLAKAFKNKKGFGVYCWLRKKRIEKARFLLKNTNMSIQNICLEVGYGNAGNFSTAFKAITGFSPKEYRKLHQQKIK